MVEHARTLTERLMRERGYGYVRNHYCEEYYQKALALAELLARRGHGPRVASAALLRCVLRYTDVTYDELRAEGVKPRVIGLLGVLEGSRSKGVGGDPQWARIALWPEAAAIERTRLELRFAAGSEERHVRALVRLDWHAGSLPPPARLLKDLSSRDSFTRTYASAALGRLRAREAVVPLLRVARGTDKEASKLALRELEIIITGRSYEGYWEDSPRPPDADTVALLESLVREPVGEVRAFALDLLGRLRDPARLPVFAEALRDSHPRAREAAAIACARTGDPAAYEPLVALAGKRELYRSDYYWDRHRPLMEALYILGDPRGVRVLAPWTVAEPGDMAWWAARALVECAGPGAAAELVAVLRGRSGKSLANDHHAFWALGQLGQPGEEEAGAVLVESLRQLLVHARPSQGAPACVEALGKLQVRAAVDLLIETASGGAEAPPLSAEWDPLALLRLRSVIALGRIGDPRAIDALIAATDDPQPEVRRQAVNALVAFTGRHATDGQAAGRRPDERIMIRLIELCDGPYARQVLPALLRAADPRAVPALVRLRETTDHPGTRRLAGRALVACDPGRRRESSPD
jgi:HEAT repeat protein